MLFRTLVLKSAALPGVEPLIRRSRLFKGLVQRFIAGESAEEAVKKAQDLAAEGFRVSLDLLGENVDTLEEAASSRDAYIDLVEKINAGPHAELINISIKLTALGLDLGENVAENNYRALLQTAAKYGTFVRADMESSDYTERTIAMVERVRDEFPETGTVLQTYLYRTPEDVDRLNSSQTRLRLVKGAYLEPESVAIPSKAEVDQAYKDMAERMLLRGNYPAFASHDPHIIDHIKQFVAERNIPKDAFEFQMLYGIAREIQRSLKEEGYRVRIYIPYGEAWYPYFTRRLAERPANLFFIAKSLVGR